MNWLLQVPKPIDLHNNFVKMPPIWLTRSTFAAAQPQFRPELPASGVPDCEGVVASADLSNDI
ncbi:MAG: hypothetical protein AAF509_11745 [Pseudomonadota bacterium]